MSSPKSPVDSFIYMVLSALALCASISLIFDQSKKKPAPQIPGSPYAHIVEKSHEVTPEQAATARILGYISLVVLLCGVGVFLVFMRGAQP